MVVIGKPEFALDYLTHIFVFDNEQTKLAFKMNPKRYVSKIPKLVNEFNLNLMGMPEMGLGAMAIEISKRYSLELLTLDSIVENYLQPTNVQIGEDEYISDFHRSLEQNKKTMKDLLLTGQGVKIGDLMKIVAFNKNKRFEILFNEANEEKILTELTAEKRNPKKNKSTKKVQRKAIPLEGFETFQKFKEKRMQYLQTLFEDES